MVIFSNVANGTTLITWIMTAVVAVIHVVIVVVDAANVVVAAVDAATAVVWLNWHGSCHLCV